MCVPVWICMCPCVHVCVCVGVWCVCLELIVTRVHSCAHGCTVCKLCPHRGACVYTCVHMCVCVHYVCVYLDVCRQGNMGVVGRGEVQGHMLPLPSDHCPVRAAAFCPSSLLGSEQGLGGSRSQEGSRLRCLASCFDSRTVIDRVGGNLAR